ncbi:MAG: glycosyltransferase [Nanoarchaeota archaeon]
MTEKKQTTKEDYSKIRSILKGKKLLFSPWSAEDRFYVAYQQWFFPLKRLFGSVVTFDPKKIISLFGKGKMNKLFLDLVKKEQPDFIFFWLITDEFALETLDKIKEISPNTKTINFFGDDDERFDNFTNYYSLFFDYCLVYPQLPIDFYKKQELNNIFLSCGINTENFRRLNLKKEYDVTFVGTPKKDRYDYIKFLLDKGVNIKVFGPGWGIYRDLSPVYYGPLNNEDLVKVINKTKINLAFTKNYQKGAHLKSRVFEIAGCSSFVLSEYSPSVSRFFNDGREIESFKDSSELLKKVLYYLHNETEREKIAEGGYKKTISRYNFYLELQNFFHKILTDKNFKKKEFKTKKKIYILKKNDLKIPFHTLKDKIEEFDYISFDDGQCKSSPYKLPLQAYSLESTKKNISCCNYYVYSPNLGNYLSFLSVNALRSLGKEKFARFISINQLMVTKEFFLSNMELLKNMFIGKKIPFLDENNTAFVTAPLLRLVYSISNQSYKILKKAFTMKFIDALSSLVYQKKFFTSPYPYHLFFESLNKKLFILKYIYEKNIRNKKHLARFKGVFFRNQGFYTKI